MVMKGRERVIALLMCFLVISIPFAFSAVQTINVRSIHGTDNVEGYRRSSNDFVAVQTEVFSDVPITASTIKLKSTAPGASQFSFDTCTFQGASYICNISLARDSPPAGVYNYLTCIGDCNSCFTNDCKEQTSIVVDALAPELDNFSINPTKTNGLTDVSLSYAITDRACSSASGPCVGLCSGIKKVEVIDSAANTVLDSVNLTSSACTYSSSDLVSMSALPNGARNVCVRVTDNVNQQSSGSSNCIQVAKDTNGPIINAVKLLDSTESYEMNYLSAGGLDVVLIVDVSSSSLFKVNATADLNGFNIPVVSLNCTSTAAGKNICRYPFAASISTTQTINVPVNVTDEGGNKADRKSVV